MLNRRRFLQALGFSAVAAPLVNAIETLPPAEVPAADVKSSVQLNNPHQLRKDEIDFQFATDAEATAGTSHTHYMTPLRISEYIKANLRPVTLVAPMRALPPFTG